MLSQPTYVGKSLLNQIIFNQLYNLWFNYLFKIRYHCVQNLENSLDEFAKTDFLHLKKLFFHLFSFYCYLTKKTIYKLITTQHCWLSQFPYKINRKYCRLLNSYYHYYHMYLLLYCYECQDLSNSNESASHSIKALTP